MTAYRFTIGQIVRLKSRMGLAPRTAEFYRITATMPLRDNLPQYRIRNENEQYERVMTEDVLEEVRAALVRDETPPGRREF